MNKNFKFYFGIWAVLFAIFNVVVFVSPNEAVGLNKFGGAFWVGYIFIALAFVGQLAVSFFALKDENLQKLFYKIPLIRISYIGLVLTLVFGTLCMVIPNFPNWIGVILCLAVLGFNAISIIKADFAADLVSETDKKVKAKTFFIKSLTVDAEGLLARAGSDEIKAECKKVYEAVRCSDPMSDEALAATESQITLKFAELTSAVNGNDLEAVKRTAQEVVILVDDRNKKCRLLK